VTLACGFPTTIAPIVQLGAVPVFVDVDPQTVNVDVARLEAAVRIPTLSDSTNTFIVQVGFIDSLTAGSVDSIHFAYTDAAGTGAAWDCVTTSNSLETRTTVGSNVVANQWYVLEISVNAAGTSVEFFIDGVLVATHTSNIPTLVARATGPAVSIRKTLGATARTLVTDYFMVQMEVTR